MAPASEQFSAPGSAQYDSDTMTVGDGTWDFTKNTFLLPNLVGVNFDTMRYNGMGNRFSTLTQYHKIIVAHAVLAVIAFLFILPTSVMIVRFYSGRPGRAIKYHAQLNIVAALMILAVFILGNFAVGPKRSLTNPHHGIGVAIFVLIILQLIGGRIIRHIDKLRSLRVMVHQWSGRAIVLLGIVQVPLGMTLYGSPKYLFVLYTLWMVFLVLVYFILSYRAPSRRELYMSGGRSEAGHTRITETEYLGPDEKKHERSSWWKWLGPLAAGAGLWAWLRRRKGGRDRGRSRSPSYSDSRGPEVLPSRRGSESYIDDEKYSTMSPPRKSGGGFFKVLGGAAAAVGAGKLASNFMRRGDNRRDEEYSAVSTETPRRHRIGRDNHSVSEFSSEYTDLRRDGSPGPSHRTAMAGAVSAADSRLGSRPPARPSHARHPSRRSFEDSDYSSYVSPSRREPDDRGGGVGKGILAGLGMGWFAKKLADRRSRKDEDRLREQEELRNGSQASRFTGDGYPSPTRRPSRRPPPRRATGLPHDMPHSEITESSIEARPSGGTYVPPSHPHQPGVTPIAPVPVPMAPGRDSRSWSRSRQNLEPVSMPPMPPDPQGILHSDNEGSYGTASTRPQRRNSSRRRRAGERAAAAAAARAGGLALEEEQSNRGERDRYGSPHSQPVSVKLKVHDDRDRNVTLRRLTEEEAMAARGRDDTESSLSGLESPSQGRGRYRRDTSQRRAEAAAERRAETDPYAPLSPPNPAFAKGRRAKDSAYYSGQPGPSGGTPAAGQTVSSLGSMASPDSHGTWSAMSPSPGDKTAGSAADNRRRRRLERRRGSSSRPTGSDMFD